MFSQSPYECKIEWGRRGAREAAERGDIVVIVDVLSFSSTVVSALSAGAIIFPYPPELDGIKYAESIGAEYILGRAEAARGGRPTLSPVTFNEEHRNNQYVLSSLNGAYCSWIASKVPALLIGSLLNASAVAATAERIQQETGTGITVVPCGEMWDGTHENEDRLRPSVEDYLGAGAILAKLNGEKSPEAEVCTGAFNSSVNRLKDLIWDCGSGRELRERGYETDVRYCSQLNVNNIVPIMKEGRFIMCK
ncbi:2-phosphosulfolactate phosphatase [Mesobacillus boroniphilus]|uniref:Probable 2-phosphosulfolactate phosphatase n=1 Tax=Mesobacillus boroniphilus TaxID=308892 RepID=A0A944CQ07_9BACI|nr:2-phosphosulfolactate phosphatase [Mesobacillus boroniphilus]MBS8266715.1 2-phosphosulfolactate phosphatase [Mesobacillus boroniphilus]